MPIHARARFEWFRELIPSLGLSCGSSDTTLEARKEWEDPAAMRCGPCCPQTGKENSRNVDVPCSSLQLMVGHTSQPPPATLRMAVAGPKKGRHDGRCWKLCMGAQSKGGIMSLGALDTLRPPLRYSPRTGDRGIVKEGTESGALLPVLEVVCRNF